MNIRYKLTIQFALIVGSILLIFTTGIFFFSSTYREIDFYKRLNDRAYSTARFLFKVKEVDEELLKIIDQNTTALYQEKVFVFDESNNQIYCNIENTVFEDTSIFQQIKAEESLKFKYNENEALGILFKFGNRQYIIIATAYDVFGFARINNLKIVLIVGFFISLLITALAGLLFSGRALAPISTVVGQVKNISIKNLNLRVDEGNKKDEIAQLAITFNQMLQRLEEAFILQRDFVSNAAHELRTPFSVLLIEIDYTLMQERDKEVYIKTLNNLSYELKKLSKLSNGLLDLARISIDNSNFELKTLRVDELLVDVCNEVLNTNADYKVNVNFESLPENDRFLKVLGNEQLIKIAIKNLVDNACKFSVDKSVNIDFIANSDVLSLQFRDKGIGIPNEDINSIFEPFYRGKNTQFIAGYGLGLALTLKIIQLHNGQITVDSKVGEGSVFSLILPNVMST
jgi:signal transduction histidine kinase